jgi:hypothetical protein
VEAGILILVVIAGVWAAFLLPPLFLVRRDTPLNTTQEFTKLTSRLASVQNNNGPARIGGTVARAQVLSRRRQILIGMFALVGVTLVAAIMQGSFPLLMLHLVADAGLAWYVMMLLQIKERQAAAATAAMFDTRLPRGSESPVRIVASR